VIGFVIVSHSEPLAHAAVDLAMQMVHGDAPPVRIAAGADGGLGTDAAAIADAIDQLADTDGVLIVTDLGSAVLSSELALDLRASTVEVRISDGPFVEGLTAGIVRAATGGALDDVAREVGAALTAKQRQTPSESTDASTPGPAATSPVADATSPDVSVDAVLPNPMGLHSRPAALIVKAVGGFDAEVTVTNLSTGSGPASAVSMIALLALGASEGQSLRIGATGHDAAAAVDAVRRLVEDGFGELGRADA